MDAVVGCPAYLPGSEQNAMQHCQTLPVCKRRFTEFSIVTPLLLELALPLRPTLNTFPQSFS